MAPGFSACLAALILRDVSNCQSPEVCVSIAEITDLPGTRQRLVPPIPPRASQTMGPLGRMAEMRKSAIGTCGERADEEDIIDRPFFGHPRFILNTPGAI